MKPPIVSAKQANYAEQQVNNGVVVSAPRAGELGPPRDNSWRLEPMANGWTEARRERQLAATQSWKPWQSSTGPRTLEGKVFVARNAYQWCEREEVRGFTRSSKICSGVLPPFSMRCGAHG